MGCATRPSSDADGPPAKGETLTAQGDTVTAMEDTVMHKDCHGNTNGDVSGPHFPAPQVVHPILRGAADAEEGLTPGKAGAGEGVGENGRETSAAGKGLGVGRSVAPCNLFDSPEWHVSVTPQGGGVGAEGKQSGTGTGRGRKSGKGKGRPCGAPCAVLDARSASFADQKTEDERASVQRRLTAAIGLSLTFMLLEVIGGKGPLKGFVDYPVLFLIGVTRASCV